MYKVLQMLIAVRFVLWNTVSDRTTCPGSPFLCEVSAATACLQLQTLIANPRPLVPVPVCGHLAWQWQERTASGHEVGYSARPPLPVFSNLCFSGSSSIIMCKKHNPKITCMVFGRMLLWFDLKLWYCDMLLCLSHMFIVSYRPWLASFIFPSLN